MQLGFHIGQCCGIKTVYHMGTSPDTLLGALEEIPVSNADANGNTVSSNDRFFHEAAPRESGEDRLARYIAYMKKRRPGNILEIALATSEHYSWVNQSDWFPVLKEFGFKKVNKQQNSNSGNVVHVFHLNIDESWPGKEDGLEWDDDIEEDDDFD